MTQPAYVALIRRQYRFEDAEFLFKAYLPVYEQFGWTHIVHQTQVNLALCQYRLGHYAEFCFAPTPTPSLTSLSLSVSLIYCCIQLHYDVYWAYEFTGC